MIFDITFVNGAKFESGNIQEIGAKIFDGLKLAETNQQVQVFVYKNNKECGLAYGDEDTSPCDGFAKLPNQIHLVDSKATLIHELTHILMFMNFGKSPIAFISEGFAELFEEDWKGEAYTNLLKKVDFLSINNLLHNKNFYEANCDESYVLAGCFIKKLVQEKGLDFALGLYKLSVENPHDALSQTRKLLTDFANMR